MKKRLENIIEVRNIHTGDIVGNLYPFYKTNTDEEDNLISLIEDVYDTSLDWVMSRFTIKIKKPILDRVYIDNTLIDNSPVITQLRLKFNGVTYQYYLTIKDITHFDTTECGRNIVSNTDYSVQIQIASNL
jgi:hypothetical protein